MGTWKALRDPTKMSGKLRWNAVLNNSGARGTYLANSAGTLGEYPSLSLFPGIGEERNLEK